jgi:hypothetical protein
MHGRPRGTDGALDLVAAFKLRAAMQVVYHHSIGATFVSDTAPAVLLPVVSTMTLAEALEVLSHNPQRLRAAIWTIARSLPPGPLADVHADAGIDRYPDALLDVLADRPLERVQLGEFERIRDDYCRQAELMSSAVIAFAPRPDCWRRFDQVCDEYFGERLSESIDDGLQAVLGCVGGVPGDVGFTVAGYLKDVLGPAEPCTRELRSFEREVGMALPAYMSQFADSIAFQKAFADHSQVQVFPAMSIAVQDADSLLTRVTVTSLVAGQSFQNLARGMDPQCWQESSDAFLASRYVHGPLDLEALTLPPPKGDPGPAPRYLEEDVALLWGEEEEIGGSCRNVLRLDRLDFEPETPSIDITFDLARSVESRLLWDVRPGGLLVDSGYLVARSVCGVPNLWRVTIQKVLLWSDREPYATGAGSGIGNALNYLAPATVSWWQESEMYSYSASPGPP